MWRKGASPKAAPSVQIRAVPSETPWAVGCDQDGVYRRNPSVQIRAIPRATDCSVYTENPSCTWSQSLRPDQGSSENSQPYSMPPAPTSKSQSLRPDQGSSESCQGCPAAIGVENLVAIPPSRPGQFRAGHVVLSGTRGSRNVAIPPSRPGQFRAPDESPRLNTGQQKVAIPPSRPGQFRGW